MNTSDTRSRNVDYIQDFIHKYKIEYSLEELMAMGSIYINFDELTFRVYANLKELEVENSSNEEEQTQKTKMFKKVKKVNLYNYSKKKVEKEFLPRDIYTVREDFIRFVYYYDQLKSIRRLEVVEKNANDARKFAEDDTITNLIFQ